MNSKVFIDSNVILRLIMGDLPEQQLLAERFIAKVEGGEFKGVISLLVVNEVLWIAENFYELSRKEIGSELIKILGIDNISIYEMSKTRLIDILVKYIESGKDFTDVYLSIMSGEALVASFDKDLSKLGAKIHSFKKSKR